MSWRPLCLETNFIYSPQALSRIVASTVSPVPEVISSEVKTSLPGYFYRSFGSCRDCNWANMMALPAAWIGWVLMNMVCPLEHMRGRRSDEQMDVCMCVWVCLCEHICINGGFHACMRVQLCQVMCENLETVRTPPWPMDYIRSLPFFTDRFSFAGRHLSCVRPGPILPPPL